MKFKESIDPMSVVGFINSYQINAIQLLAESLCELEIHPPLTFLELGAGLGRSTTAWINFLPKDVEMHVLDGFRMNRENFFILEEDLETNESLYFPKNFKSQFKKTMHLLKTCGHYELWKKNVSVNPNFSKIKKVHPISYSRFLVENKLNFDCVYIDMLDSEDEHLNCFEYFKNSLLICGDDYMSERHPYVTRAVHKFIENSLGFNDKKYLYTFPEAGFNAIASKPLSKVIREKILRKKT